MSMAGLQLQICLDPSDLNQEITMESFYNRSHDNTFLKLSQAKMLTIVDLTKGFYNIEFDEANSL